MVKEKSQDSGDLEEMSVSGELQVVSQFQHSLFLNLQVLVLVESIN